MLRFLALIFFLSLGLATQAIAQQLTQQQAEEIVKQRIEQYNKLVTAKDAAALADRYTDNAIQVKGDGRILVGRAAIENSLVAGFKTFDDDPVKFTNVKIINDDVIQVIGTWSGTWHGPEGPVHFAGLWTSTVVREKDAWKIAVGMSSTVPQK